MGECEDKCKKNCSCSAYGYVDGIGCMVYSGDLIDVEHIEGGSSSMYVRVSKSELGMVNLALLFYLNSF